MVILRIHTLVYTLLLADAAAAGDHIQTIELLLKKQKAVYKEVFDFIMSLFAYMSTIRSCPSSDSLIHKYRFIQQAVVELCAKGNSRLV